MLDFELRTAYYYMHWKIEEFIENNHYNHYKYNFVQISNWLQWYKNSKKKNCQFSSWLWLWPNIRQTILLNIDKSEINWKINCCHFLGASLILVVVVVVVGGGHKCGTVVQTLELFTPNYFVWSKVFVTPILCLGKESTGFAFVLVNGNLTGQGRIRRVYWIF